MVIKEKHDWFGLMSEEYYDQAVRELFDAAQAGLRWIPTRTAVVDGSVNPTYYRLKQALELFAKAEQRRFLESKTNGG